MPPPSAFLSISSVPYSRVITQAEFNGGTYGNTTNEVWFELVLAADAVPGFYTTIGGTFHVRYDLYQSDGSTLIVTRNYATTSKSWYLHRTAGTYYLKVTKSGGGASNFDFTFQADTRPLDGFVPSVNQIIINDDTGTFPGVVMDTDGTVAGYVSIPSGEVGAMLPSGESVWHDRTGIYGGVGSLSLFDANNVYVTSTTETFTDLPIPVSLSSSDDDFYALDPTTGEVFKVTTAGVVTLQATLSAATATTIGVTADASIVYWVDSSEYLNLFNPSDNVIHRHDLQTDSPMSGLYTASDLATAVGGFAVTPNFWTGEILVLPDESVVTWGRNEDATHDILYHISDAGALLASYTYNHASRGINHIQTGPDEDSDTIKVWFYAPGTDDGYIATILLADGSEVDSFATPLFSSGQNLNATNATLFGPSTSCTMLRVRLVEDEIDLTVSEVCCPCDCPTPTGSHVALPSHTGQILPPVDVTDWTPQCTGGGDVPSAADATDPESWVM